MENIKNNQSLNESQVRLPWTVYSQPVQIPPVSAQNISVSDNQNNTEFWF